jgi:hypothetical protein
VLSMKQAANYNVAAVAWLAAVAGLGASASRPTTDPTLVLGDWDEDKAGWTTEFPSDGAAEQWIGECLRASSQFIMGFASPCSAPPPPIHQKVPPTLAV